MVYARHGDLLDDGNGSWYIKYKQGMNGMKFVLENSESAGLIYYQNHQNYFGMEIKKKE